MFVKPPIRNLLPQNVDLAFSCGKDSIAFAHHLYSRNYNLRLIHVNNKLEGDDKIEAKARSFASFLDVPIKVLTETPLKKTDLENQCRMARIKAIQSECKTIVVCHHLGDCVENYLVNCLQGHVDYTPIKLVSSWDNTLVLRPFLLVSSKEISQYNDQHGLAGFVADDVHSLKSRRHWMRTRLIPTIHEWNFNLEKTVRKMLLKQLEGRLKK